MGAPMGPPMGSPMGSPAVGVPMGSPPMGTAVPQMPPPPQRSRPPGQQPKRGGNITLWVLAAVLALALGGTATWWFTSGRYSTVPDVAGVTSDQAVDKLTSADLKADIKHAWSNDVDAGKVISTDPPNGAEALRGDTVTVVVSSGRPRVPSVTPGTSVDEAKKLIHDAGLQPGVDDGKQEFSGDVPKGKVVRVSPNGGTVLRLGERVDIIVSKGAEPKPIPDLRGKTKEEAFQALQEIGLKPVDAPQQAFDKDIDNGKVIGTNPQPGNVYDPGTEVQVITSNAVTIPDVTNRNPAEVQAQLQQMGLQVQIQQVGGAGRVFAQNPGANTRVPPGTTVILFTIP
jgi:serine/threonine-protein kinase